MIAQAIFTEARCGRVLRVQRIEVAGGRKEGV